MRVSSPHQTQVPRAAETNRSVAEPSWKVITRRSGLPFDSYDEMQAAVRARSFNLGVDPLGAAEWMDQFGSRLSRGLVSALSVLLIVAAIASVIVAVAAKDYWLLFALPVQAVTFYYSQPASAIRKWVTLGGALSIAVFLNLLLNGLVTAATLVAYAGLTFACVRAASFTTSSSFRKALLSDETAFLNAYERGLCSLRNNRTKREYSA